MRMLGDTLSIYLCLQRTGLIIGKDKSGLGLKRAQCQQKTATWVVLELQRKKMDKTIHRFDRSDIRGVCLFSQVFQSNSANTIFGKQQKKNDTIFEKNIFFLWPDCTTSFPPEQTHQRAHRGDLMKTGLNSWNEEPPPPESPGGPRKTVWVAEKRIETTHYDR